MEEVDVFNEHAVANPEEVVAMVHMWVVQLPFSFFQCEFVINVGNSCMTSGNWYI